MTVEPGDGAAAVAEAAVGTSTAAVGDGAAAVAEALERKALPGPGGDVVDEGGQAETQRAELAAAAALDALLARQQQVIVARVESPKARRGTVYWEPPPAEPAPMDAAWVVQAERWQQETVDTLMPIAQTASTEAGAALLGGLVGAGLLATSEVAPNLARTAGLAGAGAVVALLDIAREAMGVFLGRLTDRLVDVTASTADLDAVTGAVRAHYTDESAGFSAGVAEAVAVGTVNGVREGVAAALVVDGDPAKPVITRSWVSRKDNRVRDAHRQLDDGRELPVGTPFRVDGATLRWPRDPMAPLHLTIGCRCRLRYRFDGGQLLALPPR